MKKILVLSIILQSIMLIDVLRKCGKHEMAEKLHSECDKYNNEKTKIATGTI